MQHTFLNYLSLVATTKFSPFSHQMPNPINQGTFIFAYAQFAICLWAFVSLRSQHILCFLLKFFVFLLRVVELPDVLFDLLDLPGANTLP